MHGNYFRPGGVAWDLPDGLLEDISEFAQGFVSRIDEMEALLTANRIWLQRLKSIGVLELSDALNWGSSGVIVRGSGLAWYIRTANPYEIYDQLQFKIPVGTNGDCFDRYLIRVEEMRQSISIILQCINSMPSGPIKIMDNKVAFPTRETMKHSMEGVIHHFKLFSSGYNVPTNSTYTAIESPKGELGIYLVSDGTGKPVRCKIRSPDFSHLALIKMLGVNNFLADIVTLIGTLDVVFGSVDR